MDLRDPCPIGSTLAAALRVQQEACHDHPMPTWRERESDLRTLERFVKENQVDILAAVSADYGHRSQHETLMAEVMPALAAIRHALRHGRGWMRPQRRGVDRLSFGLAQNRVLPQPLGVVGVIVPWNFPLNLSIVPLAGIFAAGNRAMVKFSENSRHFAHLLGERLPRYFPSEKLQVVSETGGVGLAFSQLPFDHLLFTGSTATGRAVMAAAAANLCPVTLELGGKSPALVCDDYDLRTAMERIAHAKCLNAGQICTSVDQAWLPVGRLDEAAEMLRETVTRRYGTLASSDYTSIIDGRAYRRLREALAEAEAGGARVVPLLPGAAFNDAAHRLAPHVVLDAPEGCALLTREIFGPILPLRPYTRIDEAVSQIRAAPRPLAFYPFSNDRGLISALLEQVMSGGVSVNDTLYHGVQDDLPFGGIGPSGMGHYHGREGFLNFSKLRPVFTQARWTALSLMAPPYGPRLDRLLKLLTG